jgi:hypothetical protein
MTDTAPPRLTPEELAELREDHHLARDAWCMSCQRLKPCQVARLLDHVESLEAENRWLREALDGVAFELRNCEYGSRCAHIVDALQIARAALEAAPGGEGEREADEDIERGRIRRFSDIEEGIAWLRSDED